ncbi:MAG TPA: DUF1232 domain-containing protein [Candidatus Udaeobacter sp.]|jgi:uncharacterized membrane protein YkvA (DUF1232 family)
MKEAKTKSRSRTRAQPTQKKIEGVSPYSKPALRSEAFARALNDAKSCVDDRASLQTLFDEAARKAAAVPKDSFKDYWPYLQTMLRLVRARSCGEYDRIPNDALLWIVAALNYLVDPFDLIPDKTPFLGFIDDAAVVEFVVDRTRQTLDDFMTWETGPRSD